MSTTTEPHALVKQLVMYMAKQGITGSKRMNLSTIGQELFPIKMVYGIRAGGARNAQGAALSAGKWVRAAEKAGWVCRSRDGFGYVLTFKGEQQAKAWKEKA